MHIKNKLRAGIGFLFLMGLITSGLSCYYLTRLSNDSKNILKDNYQSLIYVKNIAQVLDQQGAGSLNNAQVISIQNNINKEQHNITEPGERRLADSLSTAFAQYISTQNSPLVPAINQSRIKTMLYSIMQLNMKAIERKNTIAVTTANRAIIMVSLITVFCFLIAFSFAVNFPGYIANPVTKNISHLQKISDNKTTFIATMSHELKTPISAIKMSLKLLEDSRVGEMNNEQQQLLQNIEAEAQRLLQITGELLNAAQAETGNIQLNFGSTHPENIVNYAVQAIRSLAEQKEIFININCPHYLPNVMADLDKTTWVLINILSNAVKYSPVTSTIVLSVQTGLNNTIQFSVKDAGQGIDAIYLSKIFERYFKVPGAGAGQTGTGLGLAIAKDFIEAQGGAIGVESKPGVGSRFYFTLLVNNA